MANWPESSFKAWADSRGWVVTQHGWPDFLCLKDDGTIAGVEVKFATGLNAGQRVVLLRLASAGMPVYLWSPDDENLVPFGEAVAGVRPDSDAWEAAAKWKARAEQLDLELVSLRRQGEVHRMERAAWKAERERLLSDLGHLLRRVLSSTARTAHLSKLERRYAAVV